MKYVICALALGLGSLAHADLTCGSEQEGQTVTYNVATMAITMHKPGAADVILPIVTELGYSSPSEGITVFSFLLADGRKVSMTWQSNRNDSDVRPNAPARLIRVVVESDQLAYDKNCDKL